MYCLAGYIHFGSAIFPQPNTFEYFINFRLRELESCFSLKIIFWMNFWWSQLHVFQIDLISLDVDKYFQKISLSTCML